jgi:hypothetical protein
LFAAGFFGNPSFLVGFGGEVSCQYTQVRAIQAAGTMHLCAVLPITSPTQVCMARCLKVDAEVVVFML